MKKNNKRNIQEEIHELENFSSTKMYKYRDNLRLYTNRWNLELNDLKDDYVSSLYTANFGESDTSAPIEENVIKSCIETLVSKIASQHVHPFFNTINGTFKDIQIARQTQHFFDIYFQEKDANSVVVNAFRNACIFNTGVIYIDREAKDFESVYPWQIYIDPREFSYSKGKITRIVYKRPHYPTFMLNLSPQKEVTLYEYWDMKAHKKWTWIPELNELQEETIDYDELPFIFLFYDTPIKGFNGLSIPDQLRGIQIEINRVVKKIKDACDLSPAMTYFVPDTSSIKTSKLTNRTGEIITYTPTPDGANPITVSTPAFVDPQNIQWLQQLKEDAYEIVGISQLSATSQKPQGLNSGVALQTMEDIESDRFETQLNQVVRAYTEIAKKIMAVFDPNEEVLPVSPFRNNIKWADVVALRDSMTMQFSSIDSLSKDPSQKLQQIQALIQAGFISQSRAGTLLQMPDLEQGYNFANNQINAVCAVIDNCIYNDDYDIPDFVNMDLLQEEIINTMSSLYANDANRETIAKLQKLMKAADDNMIDSQTQTELATQQQFAQEMNAQMQEQLPQIRNQAQAQMNEQINEMIPDMSAFQNSGLSAEEIYKI